MCKILFEWLPFLTKMLNRSHTQVSHLVASNKALRIFSHFSGWLRLYESAANSEPGCARFFSRVFGCDYTATDIWAFYDILIFHEAAACPPWTIVGTIRFLVHRDLS